MLLLPSLFIKSAKLWELVRPAGGPDNYSSGIGLQGAAQTLELLL